MTIFKFYTYYLILVIDQVKMHSANYTLRTLLFCIPLIHAFDKIYCTNGTHLYSIWKEWYLKNKADFIFLWIISLRIAYLFSTYHWYIRQRNIYFLNALHIQIVVNKNEWQYPPNAISYLIIFIVCSYAPISYFMKYWNEKIR